MYYMDRSTGIHKQRLNCTEYLFKLALEEKKFDDVKMWIKNGRLCGNVVIGYLKKKGFPEVALHFVEDQQTRFNLALEYGHLSEAMKAAQEVNQPATWGRLGAEALKQGSMEIVEMAYQKTKNLDALSFHYLLTGNIDKLTRMLAIAEKQNDPMKRFNNALMLGNVEERVQVLAKAGQTGLAYLTAKSHNLSELSETLGEALGPEERTKIDGFAAAKAKTNQSKLLLPPVPIRLKGGEVNWPQLQTNEEVFKETKMDNVPDHVPLQHVEENSAAAAFLDADEGHDIDEDVGEGWGGDDDDDLDLKDVVVTKKVAAPGQSEEVLTAGEAPHMAMLKVRKLCVDLVIAGEFGNALDYLRTRIALRDAKPLLPLFQAQYLASQCSLPSLPSAPSKPCLLINNKTPKILYTLDLLNDMKKNGQKQVKDGDFDGALVTFRELLYALVLAAASDEDEEKELQNLIGTATNYTIAMMMQLAKKELQAGDTVRMLELVNGVTFVKVDPVHHFLFLQQAMTTTYKQENFIDSLAFAGRILQATTSGPWVEKIKEKAKKVVVAAEEKGTNRHTYSFDMSQLDPNSTKMCAASMTIIGAAQPFHRCSYCDAYYHAKYEKSVCNVCKIGSVGANVMRMKYRQTF